MSDPSASCRACGGELALVLDLGAQPAAGVFPLPEDAAAVARDPLRLAVCRSCGLAQLAGDGPDEVDEPSAPAPTSSATIGAHARRFVADLVASGTAGGGRRVLELASHGGYLRPFLETADVASTIVEPSADRARRLAEEGVPVIHVSGLGLDAGVRDLPEPGDLVVDHYLLSHLPRPRAALAAIAELVAPEGWLVLEFDHLLPTVEGVQFDAIRHGHRSYLSLTWLERELHGLGFAVVRAEPQAVYGGALRVWAHRSARSGPGVAEVLRAERAAGLHTPAGFASFAAGVERVRSATGAHLEACTAGGRPAIGYGAPARAVTFLNALGIGPGLLRATADRAPARQGRVVPGVALPIVAPDELRELLPADVLVLAWDLADEIRTGLPWVEELGGRWIVALPELAQVGPDGERRPFEPGRLADQPGSASA